MGRTLSQELLTLSKSEPSWRVMHSRMLAIADGVAVLWAVSGALVLRFGAASGGVITGDGRPYIIGSLILAAVWWLMLGFWGSRDTTILGYGPEEYKRIVSATFWLFGLLASVSYVFQLDIARGYVALALPAGLLSLVLVRTLARQYLRTQRRIGRSSSSVLLVGWPQGVKHLARALNSQPMAGYRAIAAYVPIESSAAQDEFVNDISVVYGPARVAAILDFIRTTDPEAVALSSGVPLSPGDIRQLGWSLADMGVRLIMAPALTDIAGPRIHTQPVAGLPLIHVSTPNLRTGQRMLKRAFDFLGASVLITILSPVLAVVAVAVKMDSSGPALFRQLRVGTNGLEFEMYKFRSMVVDAEEQLDALKEVNEGNEVLFKIKDDPRITRIGRILRRYSIDELPQLFNVLRGTMSLVGPRPPLPQEVALYQNHVRRRLMVRPGLTGLWQVSGRSLLSWDESVRLDLYYVENWSLLSDIVILARTVRAVFARHGAY